jgi:N utilization substance protein A
MPESVKRRGSSGPTIGAMLGLCSGLVAMPARIRRVRAVEVTVRLFAMLRERAGASAVTLELPDGRREERRALGVSDELAEMPYLTEAMLVTLGKANIRTLDDLADLATDELIQKKRVEPRRRAETANKRTEDKAGILADYGLTEEQGNEIIMAARAHWFEDEAPAPAATEEDAVAEKDQ